MIERSSQADSSEVLTKEVLSHNSVSLFLPSQARSVFMRAPLITASAHCVKSKSFLWSLSTANSSRLTFSLPPVFLLSIALPTFPVHAFACSKDRYRFCNR